MLLYLPRLKRGKKRKATKKSALGWGGPSCLLTTSIIGGRRGGERMSSLRKEKGKSAWISGSSLFFERKEKKRRGVPSLERGGLAPGNLLSSHFLPSKS